MGTKRIGLARVQALIENLKREIKLNGANIALNDAVTTHQLSMKSTGVVLASAAGTTVDSADFIPANSIPVAFKVEVSKVFVRDAGALTLTDVGVDGDADAFGTSLAFDCKSLGSKSFGGSALALAGYVFQSAADTLRLTFSANADDTTGEIKVTMYYYDLS